MRTIKLKAGEFVTLDTFPSTGFWSVDSGPTSYCYYVNKPSYTLAFLGDTEFVELYMKQVTKKSDGIDRDVYFKTIAIIAKPELAEKWTEA